MEKVNFQLKSDEITGKLEYLQWKRLRRDFPASVGKWRNFTDGQIACNSRLIRIVLQNEIILSALI